MNDTNGRRDFQTKRHGRWAWEATRRLGPGRWVVAYGPTRRSALRRLRRQTA